MSFAPDCRPDIDWYAPGCLGGQPGRHPDTARAMSTHCPTLTGVQTGANLSLSTPHTTTNRNGEDP